MPKAFEREAGLEVDTARERLRSALAEGKIVAVLRMLSGQRHDIPQRMWDKDRTARKVYPRFHDGWMRMGLNELSGPYVNAGVKVHRWPAAGLMIGVAALSPAETRFFTEIARICCEGVSLRMEL